MKTKLLIGMWMMCVAALAQPRQEINLKTWEFSRDGQAWTKVNIPHDWAIAGPFDKKWDLQKVAITQNGETEATEKSGRSGALPWIGEGWYRTTVTLPEGYEAAELLFDGAMAEPRVTINGKEAGYWAYGYNAFRVDATPYIKAGKLDIGVHLQNLEESSRWYPGAGLYRPVTLILKRNCSIDDWSVFARTVSLKSDEAEVAVDMTVRGHDEQVKAQIVMADATGNMVAEAENLAVQNGLVNTTLKVKAPRLWSPETPYLDHKGNQGREDAGRETAENRYPYD